MIRPFSYSQYFLALALIVSVHASVQASGQFVHLATGDYAVRYLASDLKVIINNDGRLPGSPCGLGNCKQIYRNAVLFPDAWGKQYEVPIIGSEQCSEPQAKKLGDLVHSPEFLNRYADAISRECREVPPLGPSCAAFAEKKCAGEGPILKPACKATWLAICKEKQPDCERYISHFMGSAVHTISDSTFDKYFVNTAAEQCSMGINIKHKDVNGKMEGQYYTDQNLDVTLGRGVLGAPPNDDGWVQLEPGISGVSTVVANFLQFEVLPGLFSDARLGPNDCEEDTYLFMQLRQTVSQFKRTCGLIVPTTEDCGLKIPGTGICCGEPRVDECPWAEEQPADQWEHGPGGIRDTSREIAPMLNTAWRLLKDDKLVRFSWHTDFADRVICVGQGGSGKVTCGRAKAAATTVLGH